MLKPIYYCIFMIFPHLSFCHVFVPLEDSNSKVCDITSENQREECAKNCIDSIKDKNFCYGFTFSEDSQGKPECKPNLKPVVLPVPYFFLAGYFEEKCTVTGTPDEAKKKMERFVNPQIRFRRQSASLYYFHTTDMDNEKCIKSCEKIESSKLVSIHSKEENKFLHGNELRNADTAVSLNTKKPGGSTKEYLLRIGALIDTGKQEWKFMDDSPKSYNNFGTKEPFSKLSNTNKCLAMKSEDSKWYAIKCDTKIMCVCKKKLEEKPKEEE